MLFFYLHPHSQVQRLYEKYLRAESFRKSLAYQKRYLLLVLGGFQECEQVTLALIARMGAYPSRSDLQAASQLRSRPINRFRTGVRVVIAIARSAMGKVLYEGMGTLISL